MSGYKSAKYDRPSKRPASGSPILSSCASDASSVKKVLRTLIRHQPTWHSNRHTFCSWLALAGVQLKHIQELSGHKTISMVARYAHLLPHVTADASERMVAVPVA